ncbi:hypothetical protein [Paenibacillus sp. NPDC057934]|uniref:hypothetical protein n=1 Tax=Paenibacillus sp. NPDC057934 TaxID=3346282 RepID=UPI0036DDC6AA
MLEYAGNLPENKDDVYTVQELAPRLRHLIGEKFILTGKPKTDGSNMRKMVAHSLGLCFDKKLRKDNESYIVDKKGTPKISRHLLISYLATPPYGSKSYNLQPWNYNPSIPNNPLVFRGDGSVLFTYDEIKIAIVWVNRNTQIIESITIATPTEIAGMFGPFGKPTVKHQMIINANVRREIYESPTRLRIGDELLDNLNSKNTVSNQISASTDTELFKRLPNNNTLYSINDLGEILSTALLGRKIDETATKVTGQSLEYLALTSLGYKVNLGASLEGMFPDIRNQLLEVKVQKKQTVDLGEFSPLEVSLRDLPYTAEMVRYLFALVNKDNIIEGIILMYGKDLPKYYHFVPEKSYKCQRNVSESVLYTSNIGQVTTIENGELVRI